MSLKSVAGPAGVLLILLLASSAIAQGTAADPQQPPPIQHPVVEVVAVTPVHGLTLPASRVPANVQIFDGAAARRLGALHVSDILTGAAASVHGNDAQASAFQPDVQFRGFTASPLLGVAQGLALYQDGVRINEVFGDTAQWDLLPATAIASVSVIPGSNPLYGLNALGGAISIQTKTGFSHPGFGAAAHAGSFGRRWIDLEAGNHAGAFAWYAGGRVLDESGWRDFSRSRVRQFFGNAGWRGSASTLDVSLTASTNRLRGNGPAPVQLLDQDRSAVFTHPDATSSDTALVTGRGRRALGRTAWLDGVAYYRPSSVRTFNGDDTEYEPCEDAPEFLCAGGGDSRLRDPAGGFVESPIALLDATNNTTSTRASGAGASLQLTTITDLLGQENHFLAGVSLDRGTVLFRSDTELARLTDDRGTVGAGIFDGDAIVRLRTRSNHASAYIADYLGVTRKLTVMGAGRLVRSRIVLRDLHGTDLNGDHAFTRFNPAAGLTFDVAGGMGVYGSFTQSSRVPTPSELGCADPDAPCRLPNAFVADPPLEEVVARTLEGGLRRLAGPLRWSAAVFRTRNRNDIIFVSSGRLTNQGYFRNVPGTRRQGLEAQISATGRTLHASASYTRLSATFDSPLVLSSPNHPLAAEGEIAVGRGDRLPLVPRHNVKAILLVRYGGSSIAAQGAYTSRQVLRGDEAGLLPPVPGAFVLGLRAEATIRPRLALGVSLQNVLNARYATFGALGEADDVLGDDFDDPRFLSPGAPRALWVGLRIRP